MWLDRGARTVSVTLENIKVSIEEEGGEIESTVKGPIQREVRSSRRGGEWKNTSGLEKMEQEEKGERGEGQDGETTARASERASQRERETRGIQATPRAA